MALKWTKDAPTEAGWYWREIAVGSNRMRSIVECQPFGLKMMTYNGGGWSKTDAEMRWAGPIPEPVGD